MLSLLIIIVFGIGVALFATQNTQLTSVIFGQYGFLDVPMYAVVLGAMLFGIFVSWLISLVGAFSTSMTMRGKEGRIRDVETRLHRLEERNHELEIENAQLRGDEKHGEHTEHTEHEEHRPLNPFVKLRQRFS